MATDIEALTTLAIGTNAGKNPRQFQGLFQVIPFTFTIEEDSVAAAKASQADLTVTGAELGDFVLLAPGKDMVGAILYGHVSAANTVTVTYLNVDSTDANTALATVHTANGVILKPQDNVVAWGP